MLSTHINVRCLIACNPSRYTRAMLPVLLPLLWTQKRPGGRGRSGNPAITAELTCVHKLKGNKQNQFIHLLSERQLVAVNPTDTGQLAIKLILVRYMTAPQRISLVIDCLLAYNMFLFNVLCRLVGIPCIDWAFKWQCKSRLLKRSAACWRPCLVLIPGKAHFCCLSMSSAVINNFLTISSWTNGESNW